MLYWPASTYFLRFVLTDKNCRRDLSISCFGFELWSQILHFAKAQRDFFHLCWLTNLQKQRIMGVTDKPNTLQKTLFWNVFKPLVVVALWLCFFIVVLFLPAFLKGKNLCTVWGFSVNSHCNHLKAPGTQCFHQQSLIWVTRSDYITYAVCNKQLKTKHLISVLFCSVNNHLFLPVLSLYFSFLIQKQQLIRALDVFQHCPLGHKWLWF